MAIFDFNGPNGIVKALTDKCMQYGWGGYYYFPCCPKELGKAPEANYFQNLKIAKVFAYNDNSPRLIIVKFQTIKDGSSIIVMCEREGATCEREGFKPWIIVQIIFNKGLFIHTNLGAFFEKDEADEQFFVIQTM